MGILETIDSILSPLQRINRIACCVFPVLFGLFMVLWGIFLNDWDWILICAGLAISLIFGYATYQAIIEG